MFDTGTKVVESICGKGLLSLVQGELSLPVFAIGGITAANAGQLDAHYVAVCSGVIADPDPGRAWQTIAGACKAEARP